MIKLNYRLFTNTFLTDSLFKNDSLKYSKIAAIALTALSLFASIILIYRHCNIKQFFTSCSDSLKAHEKKEKNPKPQSSLEQQMQQARQEDSLTGSTSWKQGLGSQEKEQTLDAFKTEPETQLNINRRNLKVVMFGEISSKERQILEIVSDYLQTIHGLSTTLESNPLPLYNAYMRHHPHPQYAIENHLARLNYQLPQDTFCLGFTNQDLYPYIKGASINFIFGVGDAHSACGLFSTYRLSTDNFEQTLKRLMKLATHEFAHMRGISHCTEYLCNMQGANSLIEGDQTPLTFCAQDMAKICHLNEWSLKEGYERQLTFFTTFSERYQRQVDFSQEIAHLKKKICKIENCHS